MNILLIFNPFSAQKKARKYLPQIKSFIANTNTTLTLKTTAHPGHATEIVQNTVLSEYDGVIAAGGDGTLFEVVNGYMNNTGKTKPPIGIIPVGTGNAFARDLDLMPNEIEKALNIITAGKCKAIDAGFAKMKESSFYFLNILGFGFVADINKSSKRYKALGNVAYTLGVFEQLLSLNSYQLKLETENGLIERDNHFVEVSNTRYTGTSFLMAPEAKIDDGYLDITLLNKTTRRRVIKIFPSIFNGRHTAYDEVESFKAKKIKVETETPKVLTPDGELMGSTPLEIECLKQAIQVFWP